MSDFITINGVKIKVEQTPLGEYLSLTDLAKLVNEKSGKVINSWIKSVQALEYLNEWELLHNPDYDKAAYIEIRLKAGSSSFFLSSSKWISKTKAVGIQSSTGRYGSTMAHHLIALEFCATLNPKFRINVFREFLELKKNEAAKFLQEQEFYLSKIEDNTLENNRLVRDIQERVKKMK